MIEVSKMASDKKNDIDEEQAENIKEEVSQDDISENDENQLSNSEDINSEIADEDNEENNLIKQNKEYEDLLKRKQAEFENYRKRTQKEKSDFYKYANYDILKELLDIVDNYGRAMKIETNDEKMKSFLEGFQMIKGQLDHLLDNNDVKPSTALGDSLDVNLHQAIQFEEIEVEMDDEVGEEITEIFQQGYLLHERVIRLATVKVKRKTLASANDKSGEKDNINK